MKATVRSQMTKTLLVLILSSVFVLHVHGQEQKRDPLRDSSANKAQAIDARWLDEYPAVSLPQSLKASPVGLSGFLSQPPPTIGPDYGLGFLRLSLASPMPSPGDYQQKLSLATCWTNDLRRQQEYHTFRMILGSIQAGGAAYLAYRYIKKYGFK
jgi:hypothetical protein